MAEKHPAFFLVLLKMALGETNLRQRDAILQPDTQAGFFIDVVSKKADLLMQ